MNQVDQTMAQSENFPIYCKTKWQIEDIENSRARAAGWILADSYY